MKSFKEMPAEMPATASAAQPIRTSRAAPSRDASGNASTRIRKGPSLAEQAYDEIKRRILSLEFGPGQLFNELMICELIGFSRSPVHHAIQRLKLEGLIDIIPRKGLQIRRESMDEILDLLEARWAVEANVAALAAQRRTDEQLVRMRALLAASSELNRDDDRDRFMQIDHDFHAVIAEAAGNSALTDIMRSLHERSARLWKLRVLAPGDLPHTQDEHHAVLEAIEARDSVAASNAMAAHLASLRRRRVAPAG
ncbi:HTH-type transcriptional repressor RspR [Pandoraea iniqua]|uniref:HTH-type transcriptional repressor RspR n=1 Tax=Pandoraea iniqua TaxID=2508288 RepID=A0A5E4SR16_9BURK|nr:GntR family transcriptional regulator [Pandoraea iniqua]VVD78190.1 HTH-type transcriptional repressor RspR [Pandoraea iniqua]